MTPKELDTYIQSSIILSTDRIYPISFDKIVLNTITAYGNDNNELSRGLKSKLRIYGVENSFKNNLLKSGYIKRTDLYDSFILTKKGIEVQEAGDLLEYLKKSRIKRIKGIVKFIVLYILTPILAFLGTYFAFFPSKPKEQSIIQIDTLGKQNIPKDTTYYNGNSDTIK